MKTSLEEHNREVNKECGTCLPEVKPGVFSYTGKQFSEWLLNHWGLEGFDRGKRKVPIDKE